MKILAIIMFLLIPAQLFAMDGEVYFGHYFENTTIRQAPGIDEPPMLTGGIKLSEDVWRLTLYGEVETLLKGQQGIELYPASVIYTMGTDIDLIYGFVLNIEHACWHSIDTTSGVEQYNLIKMRYKF